MERQKRPRVGAVNECQKKRQKKPRKGQMIRMEQHTIKDTVVKVGDNVSVRNSVNKKWVGKVFGIFRKSKTVYAEVAWYYGKDEIPNAPSFFLNDEELARSYHFDLIQIETIDSICKVYIKQEYDALTEPNEDDYFCRFDYCHVSKKFKERLVDVICSCQMPPEKAKILIECDSCHRWYHDTCMDKTSRCIGCGRSSFSPCP